MAAADGVDARARRVAARLLASRGRRSAPGRAHGDREPGGAARVDGSPRHHSGGHPAGAARIARTLKALERDGWYSLAQARRPGGPGRIDHLVIGPGGIVVVDSRAWVGRIEVNRGIVQQNGFWRECETAAVAEAAGSITAMLLPQHRTAVHAVICVAQHDLAEHVVAPGVHVVGVPGLARTLQALPYRLHPAEVLHLVTTLRHALVDAEPPEPLTTAELDSPARGPGIPGAHREPSVARVGPDLYVPVAGSSLRSAARSAARRGRPHPRWWENPGVAVPRALLAALLLLGLVITGPGLVRSVLGAVAGSGPAASVLPAGPADGTGSGGAPGGGGPAAGGTSVVRQVSTAVRHPVIQPAHTAIDQAPETVQPDAPPGGHGGPTGP